MKTITLTETQVNLLMELLTDGGELVPTDYYQDYVQSVEIDGDVFDGVFYGVPITDPLEPNNNAQVLENEIQSLIKVLQS